MLVVNDASAIFCSPCRQVSGRSILQAVVMNVLILGAGVVGFQLAQQLVNEGKNVTIIEKDPERAKYVSSHLDCMVINENGTHLSTFQEAGASEADSFISVADIDEVNMIACGIVSSEFRVPIKIARVRNADYSRARIFEKGFLGIDYVVNPEVETARHIANTVALGADSDVMLFENTEIQMRNLVVDQSSFFANRSLKQIRKTINEKFLVPCVIREDSFVIPSGDFVVRENDNIYLLATRKDLTRIFMETGRKSERLDRIIIAGGGRIGSLVCQYLIRTGRKITIIDSVYENCKSLSERFPDALVLHADVSDEDLFEEERLDSYDLIITTTNNEELNILTAVYAKSLGVKRALALVTKSNYVSIASRLKIDSIVSPKVSTVDAILKFLRRGNIRSVHSIFNGMAEVLEFKISGDSPVIGRKIMDISMPSESLILSVIRGQEQETIPDGNFVLEEGDTLISIVDKKFIADLEKSLMAGRL